ncbi:MAG: GNAT family N-acetyltransferase [Peptococcaceae bacterium]|nr:GNAT family N-acetyltransferase [Peptococcaceae bacterium]
MKIKNVEENVSYDSLANLEKTCFPDDAWSSETIEALLCASIRYGFVIEKDDQLIGYVLLTCFEGEAEIERIGIVPPCRGFHYGRILLEQVFKMLEIQRCVLEVKAQNISAIKMYQACGFVLFGKRPAYYHDGSDALMMEWKRENE